MSERFYDEEIAPALKEIMRKCHEAGMPFLATVEYEPGCFGTSADLPAPEERSLPMDWAYAGARSNGNVDVLIARIVRMARERGHSSAYLMQLGVPLKPTVPA